MTTDSEDVTNNIALVENEAPIDENPEYAQEATLVDMVQLPRDEIEYLKITLDTLTEMFKDLNYKIQKLEEYNKERELEQSAIVNKVKL